MSFARIMALASRIIRQVLRDRRTLALIFVVPVLIMTLLYLVLTSTSSIHTLALVRPTGSGSDRVNTLIDKLLPAQDKLKTININADQVDTTLKNGDADAAIIFPPDFALQVFTGQNPTVQIKLEGSDPNVASAMSDLTNGLARQLGIALAALKAQQAQGGQGGQGSPTLPTLNSSIPFTVSGPQYLHGGPEYTFNDSIAPVFIGIFSFFFVFLLTSVAFLRERSQGTIERVMASPLTRAELVIGYVCGFTIFALIQSLVIQVFLSGIFWPIAQLPALLQPISYVLPLTYANDALRGVMLKGDGFSEISGQLIALVVFALLMVLLSSLTVRRQIV